MLDKIKSWYQRCVKLLELNEYEITFETVPGLEDLGRCYSDPTYASALVQIRDPGDGSHPDWPRSTLHELIHVRMGGGLGTEPGSAERASLEHGVEMMTRILYRLIMGGASDADVQRVARGCARTIETARKGTRRSSMINAARIGEIAMDLGAMDLPEEAKALVQELIGLAAGGGDSGEMPPEKDPAVPATDPKDPNAPAALPPPMNARLARIDALARKTEARVEARYREELIASARKALGAECTPVFEKKLMSATPEIADAILEGALSRGAPKPPTTVAEKKPEVETNVIPLRSGEDAAKLSPLQRQNRQNIAGQIGAASTSQALNAGANKPVRTIGRRTK